MFQASCATWQLSCNVIGAMNPILINKSAAKASANSPFRLLAIGACALMVVSGFLTTSCATAHGFGRDVERAGDEIQDAAR